MTHSASGYAAAAVAAIAVVFGMAACTFQDPIASARPSSSSAAPDASSSPSAAPEASPSGSPSGAPGGGAEGLELSCLDLVSLDTMYDFDPNFGLDDSYSPAAGTPGATAVADGGIACGWVQQTSGEVVEIAAARPGEDALETLRSDAGADDGGRVFSAVDGRGVVQAFVGPNWVIATSSYFGTPEDAATLIDSALGALG